MKKNILVLMAAAAALVSCDPQMDNKDWDGHKVSAEELSVTTKQYNMNEDGTYTECADGNYIEFATVPSTIVEVYYLAADGSEKTLSRGKANGMMLLAPPRGSEPTQTVYFRTHELDGSSVTVSTNVTVQVATELAPEVKLFTSNSGTKKWKWNPTTCNGGAVWGNAGYQNAQDGSGNINGAWWGCGPLDGECGDKFDGQLQHSAAGAITGEEYLTAYMEFTEDGAINKYDKDGNLLNKGSWKSIEGWNGGEPINDWGVMAYLTTSPGAILWPYAINMNGFKPERFEVGYLSVDKMVLIYAPEGTGGWSESTWWSFMSDDDAEGFLTSGKWSWNPTTCNGGAVWGNAGYQNAQDGSGDINGAWWGCGPLDGECGDKFDGQLQHSAAGKITGEEYLTAYMTFAEDGTLSKYDKDGNKMSDGSFSVDMTPTADWNKGVLKTSKGALLWPYAINMNGFQPEAFEIGYLSGDKMVLIYAPEGTGGWSESTWWSFGKQ